MGNCSSGCATGLGITQIVIGVWFILVIFIQYWFRYREIRVTKKTSLTSVSALLFISSGSLAIARAQNETKNLVTAAFVLSTLASLLAFGLLIFCAKFWIDALNEDGGLLMVNLAPLDAMVFGGLVGVPALVMFIVATISAVHSGKVFFCLNLSFILMCYNSN